MSQSRASLGELPDVIGQQLNRLARTEQVNLRDELVFSIWPFLRDLVDAVDGEIQELYEEEPAAVLPVELVARTVSLIDRLGGLASRVVDHDTLEALTQTSADVVAELVALVDPDDLAQYIAADQAKVGQQVVEARVIEAEIVAPAPEAPPQVPDKESSS